MIIVILHFWVKTVGFFLNKNSFISQAYRSFTESRVMGTENNFWKFKLDPIIFLDFTDIWSFKYKEIRVSGANISWWVYKILVYLLLSLSAASARL